MANIVSVTKLYILCRTLFIRVWQPLCNMNATIIVLKVFCEKDPLPVPMRSGNLVLAAKRETRVQ